MPTSTADSVSVNGLDMYYESHGSGSPVVLLHGAMCTIETDFAKVLPALAESYRVIAVEQQGHGRTTDIDRPLSYEQMAEDTVLLLRELGIEQADFFGFSMGGGIALQIAMRQPERVRKLVAVGGIAFSPEGLYSELLAGMDQMTPEMLEGTPFQLSYAKLAPNPEDWPTLVEKVKQMDLAWKGWTPDEIKTITAPTLVAVGDSDIARPEHVVELFRLLGGGVPGDLGGLPASQLAVLPGTGHMAFMERADWLTPMITDFLDAPMRDQPTRWG
jgi:pimeloyl-ACP methyl ester carboxylesterase